MAKAMSVWGESLRGALFEGREPPPARFFSRRPSYPWFVVGTVCVGAFMGQVDASITQMILPVLEREFDRRLAALSWVSVSYLMVLAVLLPVFGRAADLAGRKLLYTGGFLLFIFGSALCGFAPDLEYLIGFRVVQAVGAALLQANSVAIIVSAAGPSRRGHALGLQGAAQAVGLAAGPAIGGALITWLGWRWVFWVNVPVGIVGAVLGWLVLPRTKIVARHRRFDWAGVLLLAPALTALVVLINEEQRWGFISLASGICALCAAVLLPLFVWWERNRKGPLLDLTLFRRYAFWAGNLAGLLSYAMLFGTFFLMPFVLDRSYRLSSLETGIRLASIPVMLGLAAPISGALYDRIGPRCLTVGGMTLSAFAFASLAVALNGSPASLGWITFLLAVIGLGQGIFTSPNNSSVMGAAPPNRIGAAGGMLNVTRSFGNSIGIATASTLLGWQLMLLTGRIGDTIHAPRGALLAASHSVVIAFAVFALVAGALSSLRPHHHKPAETPPLSG